MKKNFYNSLLITSLGIFLFWPITIYASPNYLVISQIQITGGTGQANNDFVEIFNPTATAIDLQGYRLVKRTATSATDTGLKSWTSTTIIPAYGFYLWANSSYTSLIPIADATTTGTLADNNGVALRQGAENTGTVIDSVAWGTATNTFVEGTAYTDNPGANEALIRKITAPGSRQDTNNNSQDFTLQTSTPHNSSSAPEIPTDNLPPSPAPVYTMPLSATPPSEPQAGEIVINEFVADPVDGGQEWIELYNRADRQIDLTNFTITEGSGAVTSLTGALGTYEAGRYYVLYSPKGNLNNSGDIIILKYQDQIIDQVSYGTWDDGNKTDNAPAIADPLSCGRIPNGTDTNNDAIDFIKITPTPGTVNTLATIQETENLGIRENSPKSTGRLSFNELYPNPPLGDLDHEFIELINLSTESIDLAGWKIFDDVNQYIIRPEDFSLTIIKPNGLFVLPRQITKIALNNTTKEKISLTSPDGKTTININYSAPAPEGATWAKDENNKWFWSTTVTRGQVNIITLINEPPIIYWELPETFMVGKPLVFDASDTVDPNGDEIKFTWDFGDGSFAYHATPTHIYTKSGKYNLKLTASDSSGAVSEKKKAITIGNSANNDSTEQTETTDTTSNSSSYKFIAIKQIKNLTSRTKVQVQGIVANKPDTFGKNLFLVGSGIQLYLSTNDRWPELEIGDQVIASGTISQTKSYGTRILIKQGADIKIINSGELPIPANIELEEITSQQQGWFITTTGTVTRQDKTSFTLLAGEKTLKINYKTKDTWPELAENNQVTVTGFLVLTNSESRLWPRDPNDIVIASEPTEGKILGTSDIIIETEKTNWLGYIFIGLALAIIMIGWLWEKKHWPSPAELWQKLWRK